MKITPNYRSLISRLLHLDIDYFLKSGVWAFFQQTIGIFCGLTVSYFFGHYLTKTVYGEYNLVLSLLGMLTFLGLPGMDQALIHSVSSGYDNSLKRSLLLKFKFSLLGIPVLIGFSFFYFYSNQFTIGASILVLVVFSPFLNIFSSYPAFLTAKRKFGLLSILAIFSSVFFLITYIVVVASVPTTFGLISAYCIAISIPSVIGFYISKKFIINRIKIEDKNLASYSTFLTGVSVLPWISGNIGNIILAYNLGVESLAIYSVASKFLTAVQKNFIVFYKPITAKLAIQNSKDHINTIRVHGGKLLLVGLVLAALLWFFTPLLITFFFTESYKEAILFGQILSLALIPLPLNWVVTDMVVYQQDKRTQLLSSIVPSIVKILLLIIIIPKFKIEGLILVVLLERYLEPLIPFSSVLLRHQNKT